MVVPNLSPCLLRASAILLAFFLCFGTVAVVATSFEIHGDNLPQSSIETRLT